MPANKRFFTVSVEGGDSTGKNTQTKLLKSSLEEMGFKVKSFEVPVRSFFTHRVIYFMLKFGLAMRFPRAFHFLQFWNKFWWQTFSLPCIIRNYDVVILDRWHGSYWVYGLETGLSVDSWLMRLYYVLYKPNVTVTLIGSRHQLERRDQYEKSDNLQERVRVGYLKWSNDNYDVCKVVNANQDVLDVHADVLRVLFEKHIITQLKKG